MATAKYNLIHYYSLSSDDWFWVNSSIASQHNLMVYKSSTMFCKLAPIHPRRSYIYLLNISQGKWVSNTAPYLCRTCHKDGTITENRADLRGAVHIPYWDYFWRTSKTASVKISVQYRQSTSFFPFHTVADTVLWDRTVVLTVFNPVFVTFTEYEGHRLQALV